MSSIHFKKYVPECSELREGVIKNLSEHELKDARETLLSGLKGLLNREGFTEDMEKAYLYGEKLLDTIDEELEKRKAEDAPVNKFSGPSGVVLDARQVRTNYEIFKSPDYRSMFFSGDKGRKLENGDFETFEEFTNLIASGRHDARLQSRTMVIADGAKGGFSVPEEFSEILMDASLEGEIVRPRAKNFPMISNTRHIPAWKNSDHSSDVFGGLSGEWLGENSTATIQDAGLRTMQLTAHKLAIYTEASREVMQDGLGFGEQLVSALKLSIGFYLDTAFLTGNGVGKLLGLVNSPAAISVSRAGAGAVSYADVIAMYGSLHPVCQANGIWLASHSVLPQLLAMTDAASHYIWIPSAVGNASQVIPTMLLGKPIIFTEKLPALGTAGDLILADLTQYAVGLRQEIVLDRSNAPGWTRDVESFRVVLRADGQSLWDQAHTLANGSVASCIVKLV